MKQAKHLQTNRFRHLLSLLKQVYHQQALDYPKNQEAKRRRRKLHYQMLPRPHHLPDP
jgi:hypothetical protein